jgi:hypothetical protein
LESEAEAVEWEGEVAGHDVGVDQALLELRLPLLGKEGESMGTGGDDDEWMASGRASQRKLADV